MYKIKDKKRGRSLICSSTIQWPQCKVTEVIFIALSLPTFYTI